MRHRPDDSGAVEAAGGAVRVWDVPTRLFHWALVLLLASAWVSFRYSEAIGDNTMVWHRWNGIAVLVLLVWRLLWGVVGSSTSRWCTFVRWPWRAAGYLVDLLGGRSRHYLGHNPLGTYMVLALIGVVGAQAVLGLFTVEHNDTTYGPLYKLVSEANYQQISRWHRRAFYWVILPLVAVHVAVNVLYGVILRDPLIKAMVTGRKPRADYVDSDEAELVAHPAVRSLACLILAAILVLGSITALGGKLF